MKKVMLSHSAYNIILVKNNNTTVAVHYDYTHMKNAIATLPIWNATSGDFEETAVNAKEK